MTRPQWSVPHIKDGRQYGLGVIAGSVGERKWFGHAGAFPGFISRTATVPAWGVTVSIVTNAIDGFANPWVEGVISILDAFSRRGAPEGAAAAWAGRWWTIWGAIDLVPAGSKVLVAAPARLDPFGEAGELEVSDATSGRIVLADGFASHGEPVSRTIDAAGSATQLRLGGAAFMPESALIKEIASRRTASSRNIGSTNGEARGSRGRPRPRSRVIPDQTLIEQTRLRFQQPRDLARLSAPTPPPDPSSQASTAMPTIDQIEAFADDLTAIRRDFHAHPEIGFEERRTSAIVAEKLRGWGLETHTRHWAHRCRRRVARTQGGRRDDRLAGRHGRAAHG